VGGPIGLEAEALCGQPLSDEVSGFCDGIFQAGGAVLAGAGRGRFVYDLRKRFDLFYKLSPLRTHEELSGACRVKPEYTRGVDIVVVRDNASGVYQGRWLAASSPEDGRRAEHSYSSSQREVRRILEVAAKLALRRRGHLAVVVKNAGVPSISALWRETAAEVTNELGVEHSLLDIDYAVYHLVQHAQQLDVVVAPNLFGDVLSDLGAVLLGSRGLAYGASFSSSGAAVYQTNHGAALELAGTDRANPVGQIFSLAMLLEESFGLTREASLIRESVRSVWGTGLRTFDVAERGCSVVGTREMAGRVAERISLTSRVA
jgi:3-isopropylmalate dehydrogenase